MPCRRDASAAAFILFDAMLTRHDAMLSADADIAATPFRPMPPPPLLRHYYARLRRRRCR
jgi:hypothetical protein